MVKIVSEKASGKFKQQWLEMSAEERMLHVLSWKGIFSLGVENELRSSLAKEWVEGSIPICDLLKCAKCEAIDLARDYDEESFDVELLAQECFVDVEAS